MTIKKISGDWKHFNTITINSTVMPGLIIGSVSEVICPGCEKHSWEGHHGREEQCPNCGLRVTVLGVTLATDDRDCSRWDEIQEERRAAKRRRMELELAELDREADCMEHRRQYVRAMLQREAGE